MPVSRPMSYCRLSGGLLASMTLCALSTAAFAGPWQVGSTSPARTITLKAGFHWKHAGDTSTWARPVVKFAAPLGEDLSFELGAGYGIVESRGGRNRGGAQDFTAKLKWRFLDEGDRRPALLVEPKFTFGTGDRVAGVGSGTTILKTPLRAGKQFGKVRLTGEVFHVHDFGHAGHDAAGYGALVEYAPGPRLVVGVSALDDRPLHDGGRWHLHWDAAFKFKASRHVELQGLVGRSVESRHTVVATNAKFIAAYKF